MLGGIRGNIPYRLRRLRLLPISNRCILAQAVRPSAAAISVCVQSPRRDYLPVFPSLPRYGLRAGHRNPNFLSVDTMKTHFLDLLGPYTDRVALMIFEFGAGIGRAFDGVESFAEALSSFLVPLPTTFRFGVEIRHAQFLEPEYFRALRENCVAHVFNSWTEMPGIDQQMNHNEAFTANFTAARALLVPGRAGMRTRCVCFRRTGKSKNRTPKFGRRYESCWFGEEAGGTDVHLREQSAGRFCARDDCGDC